MNSYEPEDYPLEPKYVPQKLNLPSQSPSRINKTTKDSSFTTLKLIKLSDKRFIAISKLSDEKLWFNEKIQDIKFSGFTTKGFGLLIENLEDFRRTLDFLIENPLSPPKRLKLSEKVELVISCPTLDTIDIRQYENSDRYEGFTKKGIRIIHDNARKLIDGLDDLNI